MIATDAPKLKAVLDDISNMMSMVASENTAIREAIADASKKFELDKKVLRRLAKTYHKQNFVDEVANDEEFAEIYETITKKDT